MKVIAEKKILKTLYANAKDNHLFNHDHDGTTHASVDKGSLIAEANTFIQTLTGGNNIDPFAVYHFSDAPPEPGKGDGGGTMAFTLEEDLVQNGSARNPVAEAAAESNPITENETAGDVEGSPLPNYNFNQMAEYLKHGYWDSKDDHYRSFNMGDSGIGDNDGILYYNDSGFSIVAGPGTDSNGISAARQALVDDALDYLGAILSIDFRETTDQYGDVDFYYYDNDSEGGAFSDSLLWGSGNGSDNHRWVNYSWINIESTWDGGSATVNSYTYQTIIHETLHCLGLGHLGPYNFNANYITDTTQATSNNNVCLNDCWQHSIMSYISQDENTTIDADYNYLITLMVADIKALHDYYGSSAFTGNTTYGFNTNISTSISQVIHDLQLYADETAFCIIDDGGTDTVDFSGYADDQNINLTVASSFSTLGTVSDIGGQVGNMTIAVGTVIENAFSGSGDDTINGNTADNYLGGGLGSDTLNGYDGNDTLIGAAGNDSLYGGDGSDVLNGGSGNDTIRGSAGNDTLEGSSGTDSLDGGTGNDTVNGGAGNDTLTGGTGSDDMTGGTGNDAYNVDNLGDDVIEAADSGTDQVNAYITDYTLTANVENLYLKGTATTGYGNALGNILYGTNNDNSLFGYEGDDDLYGLDGTDFLNGMTGNDYMAGGEGNDAYVVDSLSDNVQEAAGEGSDYVNAYVSYTLSANVERLYLYGTAVNGFGNALANTISGNDNDNTTLSGLNGSDVVYGYEGSDHLYGGTGTDTLYGDEGNDILDGGAGTDTMYGGTGDDMFYVDSTSDTVSEAADAGTDTTRSYIASYTLTDNVEILRMYDTAATGYGNALANTIYGNTNVNTLYGFAGNDTLYGYEDNDTLNGGTGNDTMIGGAGNDNYYVGSSGDVVSEAVGAGTDRVYAYDDFTLGANVERLYLRDTAVIGTGNDLDNYMVGNDNTNILNGMAGNDTLYGYDGNDFLQGGTGNDSMYGGSGDDTYYVDSKSDVVSESTDSGTDKVYAYVDCTLGTNFENLTLVDAAITGIGNSLDNTIVGDANANTLSGLAGNDTLDGDTGNDTMTGGAGNDTYVVGSSGDVVVEAASEGTDLVNAYVSHTLAANIENLYLYESATSGTGNDLDNTIVGNANANSLNGNSGEDTMAGGTGDDIYYVDSSSDVVTEAAGAGTDRVNAYVGFTLSANVENLYLYGTATGGVGNTLGNTIIGNTNSNLLNGDAGKDTLGGGAGSDALLGGIGRDTLTGGKGQDRFVFAESGKANYDTISDFSHTDDTIVLMDSLDGTANGSIKGLSFSGGVLMDRYYFEGAGYNGNGAQDSGIFSNTQTGDIWYNPTTGTVGDAVMICVVGSIVAATLDNTDFTYNT